jgi:putative intracellular protease/amidase
VSAHTDGRWTSHMYDGHTALVSAQSGLVVAICGGPQACANANLIKESPDLYEALQKIERLYLDNVGGMVTAEMFIEGARIATRALKKVRET